MDKWLYETVDGWTTYLQTKRGWNLDKLKVWAHFATFVGSLAFANALSSWREFFIVFHGIWFGLPLWHQVVKFKQNSDYPNNVRKCERLNAEAQTLREEYGWLRFLLVLLLAPICVSDLIRSAVRLWSGGALEVRGLATLIWYGGISLYMYLDCCYYLGPGKHSKELNKQEVTDAVVNR